MYHLPVKTTNTCIMYMYSTYIYTCISDTCIVQGYIHVFIHEIYTESCEKCIHVTNKCTCITYYIHVLYM